MPAISASLIPTVAPGNLFTRFTGESTLNIRWLAATDPAHYSILNRPIVDVTVRQLILAKAVDALELSAGHQVLFPFLIQPIVASGTTQADVPLQWIWDLHASLPKKWENLRLAKIKRISGTNPDVGTEDAEYTGWVRLIFTANQENSTTEVAVFYADYQINSQLTYQLQRLSIATTDEETVAIDSTEVETVAGFITFRTLDTSETLVAAFLDLVAPPTDTTDSDGDGEFDSPAVYELVDSVAGGINVTEDFASLSLSHGTGLLTDSAMNAIPELDSDIQTWLTSFNYPFQASASRTSVDSITIPNGLFREFDITAPAGDEPTGDVSGTYFPVWISRIERIGTGTNTLRFYFATYNVTDEAVGGAPSTEAIEFATMDLPRSGSDGDVVEITPLDDLRLDSSSDSTLSEQHFGRGHVTLSSLWNGTTSVVEDFFTAFELIASDPADTDFSKSSTRLSSYGISRVPKYVPSIGESRALAGSTARRTTPVEPSDSNRYVTELDQGLGNRIDLEAQSGITTNSAIEQYGYAGSLCHKVVRMVVDNTKAGSESTFYDDEVLPRLRILLGRDPAFGDFWYNGTRLLFFNGDSWQSPA